MVEVGSLLIENWPLISQGNHEEDAILLHPITPGIGIIKTCRK